MEVALRSCEVVAGLRWRRDVVAGEGGYAIRGEREVL